MVHCDALESCQIVLQEKEGHQRGWSGLGGSWEKLGVKVDLEGEVAMDEREHLVEELTWCWVRAEEAALTG